MRKYITVIISIILIAGGIYGAKELANSKKKKTHKKRVIIQSVFVEKVKNRNIPIRISGSGILTAKNKIEIYSEVQGVMEATSKEFKPGSIYKKGEILVKIRSADYYANLQAQKSVLQNLITGILPDIQLDYPADYAKWNGYLKNFDINKPVSALPETTSDQEKYFIIGKNIYTTYYQTKNLEIILQKYIIRAPFDGILTESIVTPGTVVRPGQKLGELIDPDIYEMEVSVSKSVMSSLSVGKSVQVNDIGNSGLTRHGVIVRINGKVDTNTQTVKVFILLEGKGLKEGMYLEALMSGHPLENAYEVPSRLLIDGRKLFIVNNSKLEIVPVKILHKTYDSVVVRGIKDGMQLVSKPISGAYVGMEVRISGEK
ncbi:MAG: efflux RND transporter periplasmic adaptor subunit [Candidatus Anammoxibacter sp.]